MKKELYMLVPIFFFLSLTAISGVYAGDKENNMTIILDKQVDITGDGKDESIYIKGIPFKKDDSFYKSIFLEIAAGQEKKYEIELQEGYNPKILFKDLNNDGNEDIFITIGSEGSGGNANYFLYTLSESELKELPVPDSLLVQSQFLNDYEAKIKIEKNNKTYKFNLEDRAKDYENSGLYFDGRLNEPTELMIHSFNNLAPVKLKRGQFGLKGNQLISGVNDVDVIGRIESTWIFEEGEWILLKTEVKETHYQKGEGS